MSPPLTKKDVKLGDRFTAKISDRLVTVRIYSAANSKGWWAVNESTNRMVRIRSAAKLRGRVR
jgi:hypothetical protein